MHKLVFAVFDRLPLQFRVLYRQFLLRIVDLEALSIQADIPRFLGQFAGVLIMFSLIYTLLAWAYLGYAEAGLVSFRFHMEHHLIATMMLVLTWDAAFPDKRDVLVLAPLPVRARTILLAKIAASGVILALAVAMLNITAGFFWPFVLWVRSGGAPGLLRWFGAYWFTMAAASAFVYGAVLALQGLMALVLPRRMFLRLSALLQIAAFCVFLGGYFLQPTLRLPEQLAAPGNQPVLAYSPTYWFFALFQQLTGTMQPGMGWVARRAWVGLALAVAGSLASLLLCYTRTMRKTVEEPDLVPASRRPVWRPRLGGSLHSAVLYFSVRAVARSRHHRLAFAVYLAIAFAIGLAFARDTLSMPAPRAVNLDFVVSTMLISGMIIVGLRKVFALPISLSANWVLRITQLRPSEGYIAASRRTLLVLGALPAWLVAAALSLFFRPWTPAAEHLAILALLCLLFTDLSLVGFAKVPFTCSYLPGKSNFQFVFWAFVMIVLPGAALGGIQELKALPHPLQMAAIAGVILAMDTGVWWFNRRRARSALIHFEEQEYEEVMSLGISLLQPSMRRVEQ